MEFEDTYNEFNSLERDDDYNVWEEAQIALDNEGEDLFGDDVRDAWDEDEE